MIYEFPGQDEPIWQGDIFIGIPRFDFALKKIAIVVEDRPEETSWESAAKEGNSVTTIVEARPVAAIVISQNCDALRAPDINLCEVRNFQDVEPKSKETKRLKKWSRIITQQSRLNQKWFYLPPDEKVGFTEKMGADFMVTIRVPRVDLEALRHLRKGRLNEVAVAHFRERIAEFYRRYPYDEWYPLNKEEMKAYQEDHPDAKPFPWQSSD
ncbi:MAG: hypothetical protein JRH09_19780 [Deltaproteobacteria bacterium]|nr:hypothetical protein [Deltaproteobacteria bacterium]